MVLAATAATTLALVGALIVVDQARIDSIPALSVAVFGTFLTSMSIIAAFSIEGASRWPTPWEALERAHVPAWFVVALGSVVTALLAGALDSDFLSALSLTLAIAAVPLGTWGLWGLVSLSSEQGRWSLVVDLLAHSILTSEPPVEDRPADLGEIKTEDHVPPSFVHGGELRQPRRTGVSIEQVPRVLCEYADRRELEAIVRLVNEVHAGARGALERAGSLDFGRYLRRLDNLLYIQRTIYSELADRVLSGQLGEATARTAVVRAGQAALDTAGRGRLVRGSGEWDPVQVERLVARHLTALARFAGHVTQEIDAQVGAGTAALGPEKRNGLVALRAACGDLQQAVRWAVDPEPPGMKLPPGHPWREGVASAEATLLWLWSTVESASGPFGVGLYASCQILTGEKFWESYWDGFDVYTTISRRLAEPANPAALVSAEVVRRCGGLELLTLELGATRLAATPRRQQGEPAFERDPARVDDRHAACNLFLAAGGFKPPGRDPVADLAHLLTDRVGGSLWTMVLDELRQLPDESLSSPLQPLFRHPEACALALALRLAPLQDLPDEEALEPIRRFLSVLPRPLLERTARLGVGLASGGACDGDRADLEGALTEAARFARRITPDELPSVPAVGRPSPPPPATVPHGLAGRGFEGALETLAVAEPGLRVELVQLDPRWLEEWAELRAALDAALLAGALRGSVAVRRVVLYDLPGDPEPQATRLHYRWTESLATAAGCFPRLRGKAGSYEVRQVLASGLEKTAGVLADGILLRPAEDDSSTAFEQFWLDREAGLIEL